MPSETSGGTAGTLSYAQVLAKNQASSLIPRGVDRRPDKESFFWKSTHRDDDGVQRSRPGRANAGVSRGTHYATRPRPPHRFVRNANSSLQGPSGHGIEVDGLIIKATAGKSDLGMPMKLTRVHLSRIPIAADDQELMVGLCESMAVYGRVLEVKKVHRMSFFDGQASVLLDTSENEDAEDKEPLVPLARMVYLSHWDTMAFASYKGAQDICYFCRQEGHKRAACPVRAKIVCRRCHDTGHMARECRTGKTEYPSVKRILTRTPEEDPHPVPKKSNIGQKQKDTPEMTATNAEAHAEETTEEPTDETMEERAEAAIEKPTTNTMEITDAFVDDPFEATPPPETEAMEPSGDRLPDKTGEQPSFGPSGAQASKYAPYATGTTMKVDSEEEMVDHMEATHTAPPAKVTTIRTFVKQPAEPSESDPDTNPHIICLQDIINSTAATENPNEQQIDRLERLLAGRHYCITGRTVIICINRKYNLTDPSKSEDGRIMTASIIDSRTDTKIGNIANTYLPPQRSGRRRALRELMNHPNIAAHVNESWIICGDFNLKFYQPQDAHEDQQLVDSFTSSYTDLIRITSRSDERIAHIPLPTFRSSQGRRTTIDYILSNANICGSAIRSGQKYIPHALWTDPARTAPYATTTPLKTSNTFGFNVPINMRYGHMYSPEILGTPSDSKCPRQSGMSSKHPMKTSKKLRGVPTPRFIILLSTIEHNFESAAALIPLNNPMNIPLPEVIH
ncbi:hypothetical protein BC940DRAFT_351049 [Gongronella butleri]|nr:hypothetical protein BC940DRAFT_351049 [Gongronella butleri]